MGDLGLAAAGRAGGISASLEDIFLQKIKQAQLAQQQQQADAEQQVKQQQLAQQAQAQAFNEKIRQDTLAENARQHDAANADRAGALADKRFQMTPIGSLVSMDDYKKMQGAGIPSQLFKPQPIQAAAPPSSIATGGAETLPGTFANSVQPDAQQMIRQATQPEVETQAKDAAAANKEADALKFRNDEVTRQSGRDAEIARHNKAMEAKDGEKAPKPLTLSAGGKAAITAIEQAAPLTDQAMALIRQIAPDIETNPGKYNTVGAKAGSLMQVGKYKLLGMADASDPRQQIVNLLKPIQAGQFTRSSRNYKMVELALQHMADPSQTLARQYESLKGLKSIMPEMREGVIRAEQPVDPSNPLAGSYFDPAKPQAHGPKQYLDENGNPK